MNLFLKTVNLLSLILSLLLLQSCQPVVSEGMLNDQGSYPDEIILVDALQLSSETGSSHPAFTVKLVDRINNPVPNANISLLTTSGSAFASSLKTNNNGEVDITWNFGYQVGLQQLRIIAELNGYITNKIVSIFLNQSSPSASLSTITGTTNIPADGLSQSTITITIRNSSGIGIAGIYPTFSATDTGYKNLYTNCTETNAGGVSLCTLRSRAAEIKTLQILTPVIKTGGTTAFITLTPLAAIGFSTQPIAGTTDEDFITQPIVTGYDAFGEVDTTNITSVIDLTAYSGPSCSGSVIASSLGGASSVLMDEGVATFTDLRPLKTSIKSLKATTGSLSACSNVVNVTPGAPAQMALNSGDAQEAEVTSELNPFIALVTDANDNPVPNATVNWSITSGTGALSTSSSLSDSSGLASSTLTLGTVAEDYTVEATLDGTTEIVTFSATGLAAQPATIEIDSGDLQTGSVGSPLVAELAVIVKDAHGNPVPDILINWSNITGAGSLGASSSTTDQNGIAKVIYTLGTVAGLNEVTATVNNQAMLNVTFSATGEAGVAELIAINNGDGQIGDYANPLAQAMEVVVTDNYYNLIENVTINWLTTPGSLSSASSLSDSLGIASNILTPDSLVAGTYTVSATIDGTSASITFTHTIKPPAPQNVAIAAGSGTVDLSWDTVAGADSYNVYTSSTSGSGFTLLGNTATSPYSMTIAASPNTYIVVTALQGSFESVYSSEIIAPDIPSWATQLGLSTAMGTNNYKMNAKGNDLCKASARVLDGSVYCAGSTTGSLGEPNGGGKDAIIVKFNPDATIAWIRQLGAVTKSSTGNNSGSEECTSLAVSNDLLSVYCAGHTSGNMSETNGGGKDAFIAKIASDGTIEWLTQFGQTNGANFSGGNSSGDDTCNGVVIDVAGNIYCAGSTSSTPGNDQNAFVVKLLPTGVVDWLTEINNTTNPTGADHLRDDICYSVVTDGTSVFCAGATNGNLATIIRTSTDLDIFMFSLNAVTGNLDWIEQKYEASQEDDYCLSLALNSSTTPNQLYCGGKTLSDLDGANNGGFDAFVMSINATNGAELTITQIGTIADDACLSIATNGGYVACGGETSGNLTEVNGGLTDTFVTVFTSALNHIITNQLSSSATIDTSKAESCAGISISDDDILNPGIYTLNCLGSTTGELGDFNSGLGFSSDIFIQQLEFDITFPTLFQNIINQIGSSYQQTITANRTLASESCKSIAKDSSGNTYCAGHTYGSLFETNAGGADAVVMKFDATGSLVWSVQLGEETTSDPSFDLDMDADASGDDFCRSLALDSAGNVYCGGYTSGGLKEPNGGGNDIFIMKLTEDGIVSWVKHFGDDTNILSGNNSGDDKCHAITIVSAADEIICVGETTGSIGEANAGGSDALVIKFDTDGDPVWANQIGLTSTVTASTPDKSKEDVFYAVTKDSSGFIYAAGSTKGSLFDDNLNTGQDILIAKFNITDGSRGWSVQGGPNTFITGTTAGNDVCYGLAINNDETSLFCGGSSDGALGDDNAGTIDAVVLSFDTNTGSRNWITHLGVQNLINHGSGSNGGSDECLSIAVDGSDKIYCGGKTDGSLGENNGGISTTDAFIAKIDSTGILGDIFQLGITTVANGANNENESCESILVTGTDSPICGGYTFGSPGENNGSGGDGLSSDIYIFKLDSSGAL